MFSPSILYSPSFQTFLVLFYTFKQGRSTLSGSVNGSLKSYLRLQDEKLSSEAAKKVFFCDRGAGRGGGAGGLGENQSQSKKTFQVE